MVTRKKIKVLTIFLTFTLSLSFLLHHRIKAEDISSMSYDEYKTHVNGQFSNDDYTSFYSDTAMLVNQYMQSVNVSGPELKQAATSDGEYKILEITPDIYQYDSTEVSDLHYNLSTITELFNDLRATHGNQNEYFINNLSNFKLTTMTIKEFVGNRDDLDGEYDAIVFSTGDYRPLQVETCEPNESEQGQAAYEECLSSLDTTDNLNDITETKANLIIEQYVKSGLPVIINDDIFNYSDSVFYEKFYGLDSTYSNVHVSNLAKGAIDYKHILAYLSFVEYTSQKTKVTMIEEPTDYYDDQSVSYRIGDVLDYSFTFSNSDHVNVNLYIDFTKDQVFSEEEVIYSDVLNSGNNSFSVTVPSVYNNVYQWKLEIQNDHFNTTEFGFIKISGKTQDIKVLNVVSEIISRKDNLLDEELRSTYFENNGEYKITLDSCTIKEFSKNNGAQFPCSHSTVMQDYDVILLGQDIFEDHPNMQVFNSLQEQIHNGKPVIFTSSVTTGHHHWMDYFRGDLGFTDFETDFHKFNNNVDSLKIVNKSSFVSYPNNMFIEDLIIPSDMNYALNERFQLDMNNSELVPLLNMYNSDFQNTDPYDTYNNFYYAKNGNVIYLNIGTSSYKSYTAHEHMLLANAVINANFTTLNQIPDVVVSDDYEILVNNEYEHAIINSTDSISFDFAVQGTDTSYNYKVLVNYEEVESGEIVANTNKKITLSNIATPLYNQVDARYIQVIINNNNKNLYDFDVFVANIDDYFNIYRTIPTVKVNSKDYAQLHDGYELNYFIDINDLDFTFIAEKDLLPREIILNDIYFSDHLPAGLEIVNLPSGFTQSGTVDTGYTIEKQFESVKLTLISGRYQALSQENLNFKISVKPIDLKTYNLDEALFTFNGINTINMSTNINTIHFEAVMPVNTTSVQFNYNDYVFIPYRDDFNLNSLVTIDRNVGIRSINYQLGEILSQPIDTEALDLFIRQENTLQSIRVGGQNLIVTITDLFGNELSREIPLYTYEPIPSIYTEDLIMGLNETKQLIVDVEKELITDSVKVEIENQWDSMGTETDTSIISVDSENNVTTHSYGNAVILISGYDHDGNLIEKRVTISVPSPTASSVSHNTITMYEGQVFENLAVELNNPSITNPVIKYSTSSSIITVDENTGHIEAFDSGNATIQINIYEFGSANPVERLNAVVIVKHTLDSESGYRNIDEQFLINNDINITDFVTINPESIKTNSKLTYSYRLIDNDHIASYDAETFTVNAHTAGTVTAEVTITQTDLEGNLITTLVDTCKIIFVEPVDPIEDSGENNY